MLGKALVSICFKALHDNSAPEVNLLLMLDILKHFVNQHLLLGIFTHAALVIQ
jgi:hypothetical protein